ncbi:hypothetical protein PTSG_03404 [Salpingoeca rosetta]|uniref:Uncharacterized protein n=1 Tax=Salpingoeca rosetta (strain ATCC 50818 / BSB-021) TaxID=946362 RepID=F2U537_SALR5|nr:uncharacterized protein PTSG_03404 [Salpingoeca rosetta]EGD82753.1 hypothetical protein PTSG_03404 [Salpingoeca rosetta]|eukprot:XP_004995989.1 hypothetical protein PTSG_03404 [Salpingoeca rosetta]
MSDPLSPSRVADSMLRSGNTPGRTPKPGRHMLFTPPRQFTRFNPNDPLFQSEFTATASTLLSGLDADISGMESMVLDSSMIMSPSGQYVLSPPRPGQFTLEGGLTAFPTTATPKFKSPSLKPFPVNSPFAMMSSPGNAYACHTADILRGSGAKKKHSKRRLLDDSTVSDTSALDMSSSSAMSQGDHDTSVNGFATSSPLGRSATADVQVVQDTSQTTAAPTSTAATTAVMMVPHSMVVNGQAFVPQSQVMQQPQQQQQQSHHQQHHVFTATQAGHTVQQEGQVLHVPAPQPTQQQQQQQQHMASTSNSHSEHTTARPTRSKARKGTATKRGEYKCGKCGFFPKKAKHNCALERAKRAASQSKTSHKKYATSTFQTPTQQQQTQHVQQQQVQQQHQMVHPHHQQQHQMVQGAPAFAVTMAPGQYANVVQLSQPPQSLEGFQPMFTGNW